MEQQCREYLISELEIARSHQDSDAANMKTCRELVRTAELQLIAVSEALNVQLAHSEFIAKQAIEDNCKLTTELARLTDVLDSYLQAEENRNEVHGGALAGTKLRNLQDCHHLVQQLHQQLMTYKDLRDDRDDDIRHRSRCHVQEIKQLQSRNAILDAELVSIHEYKHKQQVFTDQLMRDFVMAKRQISRVTDTDNKKLLLLGDMVSRLSYQLHRHKQAMKRAKPLLITGTRHSNSLVQTISLLLLQQLEMLSSKEARLVKENMEMAQEDCTSTLFRVVCNDQDVARRIQAEAQALLESAKKKKGTKGRTGVKSPSKAPAPASKPAATAAAAKPGSSASKTRKK